GLDVGEAQPVMPGRKGLLHGAAGAGALAQRRSLALGDRRADQAFALGGGLVEERDGRAGDRLGRLTDVDPRVGAVEETVHHVAELLQHPLALAGLAGLPADAG